MICELAVLALLSNYDLVHSEPMTISAKEPMFLPLCVCQEVQLSLISRAKHFFAIFRGIADPLKAHSFPWALRSCVITPNSVAHRQRVQDRRKKGYAKN